MGDIAAGGRGRAVRLLLATLGLVIAWPLSLVAAADQSLTGVIAIDHADNFVQHREETYPMLQLGTGERLELEGVSVDQVVPGARVSVRGRRVGSSVYVERGGIRQAGSGSVLAASTTATTTMDKRVAV